MVKTVQMPKWWNACFFQHKCNNTQNKAHGDENLSLQ